MSLWFTLIRRREVHEKFLGRIGIFRPFGLGIILLKGGVRSIFAVSRFVNKSRDLNG